jgi:signal transduction histidine kinase
MAKLLLIDDDAALRGAFAEVLGEEGHEIVEAADGPSGIQAARESRPDLVLCDVEMPGLDGYGVLRSFQADSSLASTPFLFLTGLAAAPHARAAMSMGADDYLTKPISNEDLIAAVGARLARRQAQRREGRQRLEELQRSVAFLLPHELRTPLTVILGASEILRSVPAELTPGEILETATAISTAARRLERMTENYLLLVGLELERRSGGEPDTRAAECPGAQVVADGASERASAYGRQQDLDLQLGEAQLPVSLVDARKIVYELVDNAFKFSANGTKVSVLLRESSEGVALSVTDHGVGLTADELQQIGAFRQFNRRMLEQQGFGLGVALVKGIVEATEGTLDVVSTRGEGTAVRARWPQRPAKPV